MNSVEIERRSARMSRSVKNATTAVAESIATVALTGVPVLRSTLANHGGIMWARAMWFQPTRSNALEKGASGSISPYGTIRQSVVASTQYMTVVITMEPTSPIGMSRGGFLVSSASVETASKPMYAKNRTDEALKMPRTPYGAKGTDYDEGDDNDVDDGGDVVEAGRAFRAQDGKEADGGEDEDGNRVELVVAFAEGVGHDAEFDGPVPAEGREVGSPRAGNGGPADYILEEDVAGRDEGDEVAELDSEVNNGIQTEPLRIVQNFFENTDSNADSPETTYDSTTAGPAPSFASFPVRTNIPAPMTAPMPNQIRSHHVSVLFISCSLRAFTSSSASAVDRVRTRSASRAGVCLRALT
ncbi:AT-hook-containing transcription factor [Striga asiatica]|uniref:AT-hook-containing transcription factor n=1 Tax=Striga asiatica TaxID=4170 RepID=A0A5A7PVB7_STRAF|nr:AT-hook-containing transcription factor [Striga asiatica]